MCRLLSYMSGLRRRVGSREEKCYPGGDLDSISCPYAGPFRPGQPQGIVRTRKGEVLLFAANRQVPAVTRGGLGALTSSISTIAL